MFYKGDYVNYSTSGICQIEDICFMSFGKNSKGHDYYILKPVKYESIIDIFTTIRKNLDAENGVGEIEEPVPGYYDQIVEQVIGYIKENFKDAALEDASALVSLSPNYLSKVFKRKTGVNFSEYLMRVKMENAARLLKNVTMKTYEVAFGKNPREFREQDRKL